MRSGQMKWKDRPLWYDVYAANPPMYEPTAVAPYPKQKVPIRQLFYKEDIPRARFYKQFPSLGAMNISNEESESLSRMFTDLYMANEEMCPELSEDEIYAKTMIAFKGKST
ncbi:unnamed protein product [Gongylonema pulchrum]|uniref:Small ribosomal subunit protein mS23 n=1 Tax=Gongylonema pulchrum TaxID=637853 RepID=A0A3P7M8T5_9BILA|nr:unnamed protein product [Gongylonema pulchrum]